MKRRKHARINWLSAAAAIAWIILIISFYFFWKAKIQEEMKFSDRPKADEQDFTELSSIRTDLRSFAAGKFSREVELKFIGDLQRLSHEFRQDDFASSLGVPHWFAINEDSDQNWLGRMRTLSEARYSALLADEIVALQKQVEKGKRPATLMEIELAEGLFASFKKSYKKFFSGNSAHSRKYGRTFSTPARYLVPLRHKNSAAIFLVPEVGVEPTCLATLDFESSTYTISSLRHVIFTAMLLLWIAANRALWLYISPKR